jgi:hypothetical protein
MMANDNVRWWGTDGKHRDAVGAGRHKDENITVDISIQGNVFT